MRAEHLEYNEKGEIIKEEDDRCRFIVGMNKEGKSKICGFRSSWKCDRCKKWICSKHLRFHRDDDFCIKCEPLEEVQFVYNVREGKNFIERRGTIFV